MLDFNEDLKGEVKYLLLYDINRESLLCVVKNARIISAHLRCHQLRFVNGTRSKRQNIGGKKNIRKKILMLL